jgi:hypothetical protein
VGDNVVINDARLKVFWENKDLSILEG